MVALLGLLMSFPLVRTLTNYVESALQTIILAALDVTCDRLLPSYDKSATWMLMIQGYRLHYRHRHRLRALARLLHEGRLAGRTILVTGSARGLGSGIAAQLATSGARLVLPIRKVGDIAQMRAELAERATAALKECAVRPDDVTPVNPQSIDMLSPHCGLELSSLASIERFVDSLRAGGVVLDAVINNAGMVPIKSGVTAEGFEPAFGVNFLGTVHLTQLLDDAGLIAKDAVVVNVSSEEHRLAHFGPHVAAIADFQQHQVADAQPAASSLPLPPASSPAEPLGKVPPHSIVAAMHRYAYSKMLLTTFSFELNRRAAYTVRDICPGPVGSQIARDAPWPINKLTELWMRYTFVSPNDAALPVIELAVQNCAGIQTLTSLSNKEGDAVVHYHMSASQSAGAAADHPVVGAWLWEETQRLLKVRKPPP